MNIYGLDLYSVNIYIVYYNVFIYKVLFITYSKLLKKTYINYYTIEFLKHIAFGSDIYKGVLFLVYNVCNGFNKCVYKWVFKYN